MAVQSEVFATGDVYIDFPQEDAMFRFDKASGRVFRRFDWDGEETEVPPSSDLFAQARIYGTVITAEMYFSHPRQSCPRP